MKKNQVVGNILFWASLLSPMFSFALTSIIGEVEIFGIAGIVRYSWVMLLLIPIGILSIMIGNKLKDSKLKYKKNYVVAYICLPLLLIFGSYKFIFNNITYDIGKVYIIEETTNIDLPNQIKIATINYDSYSVSYLKVTNEDEINDFERKIKTDELWENQMSSIIKSLLPFDIQYEVDNFDYYLFYNLTNDEYNMYPIDGEYECVFIAYDCDKQRIVIIDHYMIDLN